MKLLLDENLPHRLLRVLPDHDPYTVTFMKGNGVGNGQLLALAAAAGFDAFITKDTNISYQQNTNLLPCSVVILEAPSNSMDHIAPLVPELLRQLAILKPFSLIRVR